MSVKRKFTILYAEDEPVTRMLISNILETVAETISVSNGLDAYEYAQNNSFDILITDLSMPKMSGFELIYKIRESHPDVPIIVTTAFREEYMGLDAHADIIEKPIDIDRLVELVESFFR